MKALERRQHVPELEFEQPHPDIMYLLNHFYSLKREKGRLLQYTELKCYSDMLSHNIQPIEAEVIMRIDSIYEAST